MGSRITHPTSAGSSRVCIPTSLLIQRYPSPKLPPIGGVPQTFAELRSEATERCSNQGAQDIRPVTTEMKIGQPTGGPMRNPWKALSRINPQREDGNRQINSGVYRALAKADLTASEYKVALCIIDLTWGYNKTFDTISISQIRQGSGLSRRGVLYTIQSLREKRIVHYEPSEKVVYGSYVNRFLFNKHYDTWLTGERACTSELHCTSAKDGNRLVNPIAHSIEIPSIERKKGVSPDSSTPHAVEASKPNGQDPVGAPSPSGTGQGPAGTGGGKSRKPKKPADPRVKQAIDYFHSASKDLGLTPVISGGRDGKLIKTALSGDEHNASMSLDDIKALMLFYLKSDYARKNGATIGGALNAVSKAKFFANKNNGKGKGSGSEIAAYKRPDSCLADTSAVPAYKRGIA